MDDGIRNDLRHIIGLVVFDGERFLLLHRKLNWSGWEFPKGAVEETENHEEAIRRELLEETALKKYTLVTQLDEFDFYDKIRKINSHIKNYLVQVSSNSKVILNNPHEIDGEIVEVHDSFKWFHPSDALTTVTHSNQRETLNKAITYLGLSE